MQFGLEHTDARRFTKCTEASEDSRLTAIRGDMITLEQSARVSAVLTPIVS